MDASNDYPEHTPVTLHKRGPIRRRTAHPQAEVARLSQIAANLYDRLSAALPADHAPAEAADVELARELARGLSKLSST